MSDPLRLAVVGVGRMGAFHAETLAAMDTIDVVAVVDTRPGVARQVSEKVGSAYHSSASVLLEGDDVVAWLVASSTSSHAEIVGSALDAGLHILCEKPLSLDLGESEGLGVRAAASGTLLQIGFWRRFAPPWVAAWRSNAEFTSSISSGG